MRSYNPLMPQNTQTDIHTARLDNGLTLLFQSMPWLRSLSLGLLWPAGSATDPAGQEGSATVASEWSNRGAGDLDSREFSSALDALGVRRGGSSDRETSSLSASMLVDTLPEALRLLALQVKEPRLKDDEFESSRELAVQDLKSLADQPSSRLAEALSAATFTSGHGRSPYGTAAGLKALTAESVRADRANRAGPEGAVLAVAGGISWPELKALVTDQLGGWNGPAVDLPAPELAAPSRQHVTADTSQVQIGLSFSSLPPQHPDWLKQALAIGVLSGGMGARLFSEVREKRGLVYSVGAAARAVKDAGYVVGYAGTTPEKADETLEVMLAEFRRLSDGVSADELERARQGRLTRLILQGEASGSRASGLASEFWLRGRTRTLDEIAAETRALTLEELNDWLSRSSLPEPTIVTLGPDGKAEAS